MSAAGACRATSGWSRTRGPIRQQVVQLSRLFHQFDGDGLKLV
jgi:hypothetical protein